MKKLTIILIFILSINIALAIPATIDISTQATSFNGTLDAGIYNYDFVLSNNGLLSGQVYSQTNNSVTTDLRGIVSFTLTNISTGLFSKYPDLYLLYFRQGNLQSTKRISYVPYSALADNLTCAGSNCTFNDIIANTISATTIIGNVNDTSKLPYQGANQAVNLNSQSIDNIYNVNITNTLIIGELVSNGFCYQETTNESTSCGGLNSGGYGIDGGTFGDPSLMFDGNYDTSAQGNILNFTINYSKPTNAINTSLWQIKVGYQIPPRTNVTQNITIPIDCWNQEHLQFRIYMESNILNSLCYDGSSWLHLYNTPNNIGSELYEESMWWNLSSITTSTVINTSGITTQGTLELKPNKELYLSRDSNSYFTYNEGEGRVELWANNIKQQDWGASSTFYVNVTFLDIIKFLNMTGNTVVINTNLTVKGAINATEYLGDGSKLDNVCLSNGSNCNTSILPSPEFTYYVAKNGNDNTGTGKINNPFLTIDGASTYIGNASNTVEFENDSITRRYIIVSGGEFIGDIHIPQRQITTIYLRNAVIKGDVYYSMDTSLGGSSHPPTLTIRGDSLRGVHSSSNVPRIGIDGNIYVNTTTSTVIQLMLLDTGVSGDIYFYGTSTSKQLFTDNVNMIGGIHSPTGRAELYLSNADSSSSSSVGEITGIVRFNSLKDIRFVGDSSITCSSSGRLRHVEWRSSKTHNFSGSTCSLDADASSYTSYFDNVDTKGGETFTFFDRAVGVGYNPSNTSYWSIVPDDVREALDYLAINLNDTSKSLNLSGENANQNINISPYNFSAKSVSIDSIVVNENTFVIALGKHKFINIGLSAGGINDLDINATNIDIISDNLNISANITQPDNYMHCWGDNGCEDSSIRFNGSSLIIKVN